MIQEYALEPEMVANADRILGGRLLSGFKMGRGRIAACYTKKWKRLVWQAFNDTSDLDRTRLEVLVNGLFEFTISRGEVHWDSAAGWLDNAVLEHERLPFHAIIAGSNPGRHSHVLTSDAVLEKTAPLWAAAGSCVVPREATPMADKIAPILQRGSVLVFVDPHFGPEKPRYRRTFESFLERVNDRPGAPPKRVEILTSTSKTGCRSSFETECQGRFRRCVPVGMRVVVRRLNEKPRGEGLHHRYVLAKFAGVRFDWGLDDGKPGNTDEVSLLERHVYVTRWRQYVDEDGGPPPAFDQEGQAIVVVGSRRL